MITNYFKTHNGRNALIVYIESPFVGGVSGAHTNEIEVLEMAYVLKNLRYNVDIIDYRMNKMGWGKIPFTKYDLVIGMDSYWLSIAKHLVKHTCKIIYYATGAWTQYARAAQKKRYHNFMQRTGVQIYSDVKLSKYELLTFNKTLYEVDGIICTGNEWTKSTYRHINDNVYSSLVPGFSFKTYCEDANATVEKHSFLWFGGRGLIHKGLDLCIEVFGRRPGEKLYIAGPREEKFFEAYAKELQMQNIQYVGFLNVRTTKYERICRKCAFVIFPSCSEGGAASVLTVMAMGLIPIVTKEASVDVGDFGFQLRDDKIETINECVEYVISLSDEEIRQRQKKAYEYVRSRHSVESYSVHLKEAIRKIVDKE